MARRANVGDLHVGDTVIVKAEERVTLTSRWDPEYEITRARPPVYTIRHQRTGKVRTLHREKLKLVDPNITWDDFRTRPKRTRAKPQGPALPVILPPINTSLVHDPNPLDPPISAPLQDPSDTLSVAPSTQTTHTHRHHHPSTVQAQNDPSTSMDVGFRLPVSPQAHEAMDMLTSRKRRTVHTPQSPNHHNNNLVN